MQLRMGGTALGAALLLTFMTAWADEPASPPVPAEPLTLDGEVTQGALIRGRTEPGARVVFDGVDLPISDEGWFVFGFDRDAEGESTLKVTLANGNEIVRTFKPAKRDYHIQRIDGLPDKYVSEFDEETLKRIKREAALKAAAKPVDTPAAWYAGAWKWPATGPISGFYGSQRILNGVPKRPHYGVDVAGSKGTPVHAPVAGVVTLAEPDMYFEGGLVFVDHGHGVIGSFMHLDSVDVKAGQKVAQGDKIGTIGASGRATGPHLDWRMYWRKAHVDPTLLVGPMPEQEVRIGTK